MNQVSRRFLAVFLSIGLSVEPVALRCEDSAPQRPEVSSTALVHRTDLSTAGLYKGKSYEGHGPLSLVLIRDLHCQEEAQLKIAGAIELVRRRSGVSKVCLEGAEGPLHTLLYQSFPDDGARRAAGLEFVKAGYLTGAEYAAMNMQVGKTPRMIGVENASLYLENFRAFRRVRSLHDALAAEEAEIEQWIEDVKNRMYPDSLKALDSIQRGLDHGDFDLDTAFSRLETALAASGLDPADPDMRFQKQWERLSQIKALVETGSRIDGKSVEGEISLLLSFLQQRVSREGLKRLVSATLEHRLGRISVPDYLNYVRVLYDEHRGSHAAFQEQYPQLELWEKTARMHQDLQADEIIEHAAPLIGGLIHVLARKEGLREIAALDGVRRRLTRLVRLEMNRRDLENEPPDSTKAPAGLVRALRSKMKAIRAQWSELPAPPAMTEDSWIQCAASSLRFYELALARDRIIAEKTLDELGADRAGAVLITGGFHTGGIQEFLERYGISYSTWTPVVTGVVDSSRYEAIMTDPSYDLDRVEFSDRRLAWRRGGEAVRRMLSAPVLLSGILDQIGSGQGLDQTRTALLKSLIRKAADRRSVNTVLNEWMGGEKFRDALKSLTRGDFKLLFAALDPDNVYLKLTDLDPSDPMQERIAVEVVRRAYQKRFPALVSLTAHYFSSRDIPRSVRTAVDQETLEAGRQAEDAYGRIRKTLVRTRRFDMLSDIDRIYFNPHISDEVLPLIARFIDVRGIDGVVHKISLGRSSRVNGAAGELYHASELQNDGYEVICFGFEIRSDGVSFLESDLVVRKDGRYSTVEIKHMAGRRWHGRERDTYAAPDAWVKRAVLDEKSGKSRKLDHYRKLLRLLEPAQRNKIIGAVRHRLGEEHAARFVAQLMVARTPLTIIFSLTRTVGLCLASDGSKIILRDGSKEDFQDTWTTGETLPDRGRELSEVERSLRSYVSVYSRRNRVPITSQIRAVDYKPFYKSSSSTSRYQVPVARNMRAGKAVLGPLADGVIFVVQGVVKIFGARMTEKRRKWIRSFSEDFVVPAIEEGLIFGLSLGHFGIYAVLRSVFIALHAFQDRAPPEGRKRTLFERLFVPSLISLIAIWPFMLFSLTSLTPLFLAGLSAHILANLAITLTGSPLRKGVIRPDSAPPPRGGLASVASGRARRRAKALVRSLGDKRTAQVIAEIARALDGASPVPEATGFLQGELKEMIFEAVIEELAARMKGRERLSSKEIESAVEHLKKMQPPAGVRRIYDAHPLADKAA